MSPSGTTDKKQEAAEQEEPKAASEGSAPADADPTPAENVSESESEDDSSGIDWEALLEEVDNKSDPEPGSQDDVAADSSEDASSVESPADDGDVSDADSAQPASEPEAAVADSSEKPPTTEDLIREMHERMQGTSDGVQPQGETQGQQQPVVAQMTEAEIEEARKRYEDYLVGRYAVTPEDAEKLLESPQEFLPKLFSRIHQEISAELNRSLTNQFGPMVDKALDVREQTKQVENRFFERWPQLNQAEYRDDLVRLAGVYRQSFPNEPLEQLIENVGLQAMIRFKIKPEEDSKESSSSAPVQEAAPFRPAAPQRSAAPPPKPKPKNQFETLAEEMLTDDTLY